MSSGLVSLIYVTALAIPMILLYWLGARSWYWHGLCVAAALGLGFIPTPPEWKTPALDMIFGFSFIFLMVWGLGGLVFHGAGHRHKHA